MSSSVINTDKKLETTTDNIDFGSISSIIQVILGAFSLPSEPVTPLPPPLLMTGANLRPGLSTSDIASRIIARQSEAGLIVGDVFADGPNRSEAMELIRIEEIINAIQTEAKIEVAIPPGVGVIAIGPGNLGAPVVVNGVTTTIAQGSGVIR
jgi:hypothetical protein